MLENAIQKERERLYASLRDYDFPVGLYLSKTYKIRIDPNHTNAYINRGNTYSKRGEYDRAIADYTQAIRLDPTNADAYYNRGVVYAKKDDCNRAIADFKAVLKINPNDAEAKQDLERARKARGY
jgi:tetratricopeptide (TPR) repeat protein